MIPDEGEISNQMDLHNKAKRPDVSSWYKTTEELLCCAPKNDWSSHWTSCHLPTERLSFLQFAEKIIQLWQLNAETVKMLILGNFLMKCLWIRDDTNQDSTSRKATFALRTLKCVTLNPLACNAVLCCVICGVYVPCFRFPNLGCKGVTGASSRLPASCGSLKGTGECSCLHWRGEEWQLQSVLL